MSADSHAVCPKCHPEYLDKVGIWQNFDASENGDVRENYETYWENKQVAHPGQDDKLTLVLVHRYRANCWTCDWSFIHEFETPITGYEQ